MTRHSMSLKFRSRWCHHFSLFLLRIHFDEIGPVSRIEEGARAYVLSSAF